LKALRIAAFALAACIWGCTTDLGLSSVQSDLKAERIDDAVRKIDQIAAREPNSYKVQLARGEVHREAALRRLFAKDESAYLQHAETSLAAYARASEFDPRQAEPHTGTGILLFNQGNLRGALEELRVSLMLEPGNPIVYANLGQLYVFMGHVGRARTMIEKGRKLGLPPVYAETVEMLASWRQGDLVDASDLFELANQNPKVLQGWLQDDPSVKPDFKSFDELTKYCCSASTCGPHMAEACERMNLEVKRREVAAETLRREREAALESERALRKTYGGRREVEIEGEDKEESEKAPPKPK
jgi:tetratricopeptide (TPR) repeat protein